VSTAEDAGDTPGTSQLSMLDGVVNLSRIAVSLQELGPPFLKLKTMSSSAKSLEVACGFKTLRARELLVRRKIVNSMIYMNVMAGDERREFIESDGIEIFAERWGRVARAAAVDRDQELQDELYYHHTTNSE
jgi:hypothetical protein